MGAKFSPLMQAGWPVLPWAYDGDRKAPLRAGFHGKARRLATKDDAREWVKRYPDCNPGIVMPDNVIGLDVDFHPDAEGEGDDGVLALAEFERKFGPLPETGHIFHGYVNGQPSPYGTYLYRVPDSMLGSFKPKAIVGNLNNVVGLGGVDTVLPWLRYNAAPGAVHKSGETYDFTPAPFEGWVPSPSDLPELTEEHVRALVKRRRVAGEKPAAPAERAAAVPMDQKPIVAATRPETGKELLAQVRALVALDNHETMLIRGEQRGWQKNDGFFVLACAIARLAKDRDKAKRAFLKAAKGYDDAERRWDDAVEAVEAVEEALGGDEDADAYRVNVNTEPYAFAKEMLNREFRDSDGVLTLRFRHDDRTFWLWSAKGRRYVLLSDDDVRARVAQILSRALETVAVKDGPPEIRPVKVKVRTYGEVVEHLRLLTLTSEHGAGALLPSTGGIPFLNGWLDAQTGELLPSGPERDIRWNVPVAYDREAKCPEWVKFLESCGFERGSDEYRLLRQWFGYLLSGSKKFEKALLLIGESRAGKGVTIRVAEALLGGDRGGAAATSLDSLLSNFGLQTFIGKGLATVPDARFGRSDKGLNARLLSLTSNDTLPVDVKYGKPLSINLGVRVMIGTNETPNFIETSDALARRFLILRYGVSHSDNPDYGLFDRLRLELPGIARWALGGLRDLDREGRFTETKAGLEVQEQMIMNGSYVRLFAEECCEFVPGSKVTNESLGNVFAAWAEDNHIKNAPASRIGTLLGDAFPSKVGSTRIKKGGNTKRGKTGIQIRKEYRTYDY